VSPVALVESLRARFGSDGVYGMELVGDHRPERIWSKLTDELLVHAAGAGPSLPDSPDRPLWILPAPSPLNEELTPACCDDAERIESGWWDGGDIRRDYYVVTTACGQRFWVYQDCATRAWYLHGIFG
jgi:protein ImuB